MKLEMVPELKAPQSNKTKGNKKFGLDDVKQQKMVEKDDGHVFFRDGNVIRTLLTISAQPKMAINHVIFMDLLKVVFESKSYIFVALQVMMMISIVD